MHSLIAILGLSVVSSVLAHEKTESMRALQYRFLRGQQHAAEAVSMIKPQMLGSDVNPEVKTFILEHQSDLIDDVQHSPLVWHTSTQATCAKTDTTPKASINLIAEICEKNVRSREQAGILLLHESVHHLGIATESFADEVAFTVYNTWRRFGGSAARWDTLSLDNLESSPWYLSIKPLWIGDRVLMTFGGDPQKDRAYNPVTARWESAPVNSLPSNFCGGPSAVWTGYQRDEVIYWDGCSPPNNPMSNGTGSILDIEKGVWRAISTINAPSVRGDHKVFWTGEKLLVFGGYEGSNSRALFNGGLYDPKIALFKIMLIRKLPIYVRE